MRQVDCDALVQTALDLRHVVTHLREIRFVLIESALCDLFKYTLGGLLEPVADGAPSKSSGPGL